MAGSHVVAVFGGIVVVSRPNISFLELHDIIVTHNT
jgi:hypothetical protein